MIMSNTLSEVALITLDNAPVNSLSHALRERIVQQLDAALADRAIRAIVLAGNDKVFSAGADVAEFGTSRQLQEPILRSVIARIEESAKPVVAAITGMALGGGLELALGCHARIASSTARIGLPEITLGLIPGSGATQRLPRLVGIETAYDLMSGGKPQSAQQLEESGLFASVVSGDVVAVAVAHALELADQGVPYPQARDCKIDGVAVRQLVDAARDNLTSRQRLQPAYEALLDALVALELPFDEGMKRERELFLGLVSTTAAKALRYQFKAEREATKLPAGTSTSARPVRSVAVIGAGTMGTGIAICALESGLNVLLLEQDDGALERGRQRIADHYRKRLDKGKLSADAVAANAARLKTSTSWEQMQDVDLIIEAVFEDLAVKQEVFRKIDAHARDGAVLATNTSYLDVDAIAGATSRPQDVLGLHFFSPAPVMKLLEVVKGRATAPDVLATGIAFGSTLKKISVPTGNAFGFIGNRIYNAYRRQCEFMLEDGAWPEDVDNALTAMGFAMGPFAVADLSGLDIAWRMRKSQAVHRDPRERYVAILDRLCEAGRLGRKAGAGYYTYIDGKQTKTSDSTVREIIEHASTLRGISRRALTRRDIQRRALLSMVNESALLLAEGVASRPSDIDVVMVQGYGFPRWEGGPVFWARQQERAQLETELKTLADEAGYGFVLADLAPLYS
jgi:3-hydroxyacyl-CoA dehydrogenase